MHQAITTRSQKKAQNRLALIQGAAQVIAQYGIAEASITRIIQQAGLSRGMVHLHFDNKEALLIAVAVHMNQQYFARLEASLQRAPNSPQHRLEAIVLNDLSEAVLNLDTVNTWHAFRAASRAENAYIQYSDTRDSAMNEYFREAFLQLAHAKGTEKYEGDAQLLAKDASHGTLALLEGLWSDYLLHSNQFSRKGGQRIVFRFLQGLFPQAFDLHGALTAD